MLTAEMGRSLPVPQGLHLLTQMGSEEQDSVLHLGFVVSDLRPQTGGFLKVLSHCCTQSRILVTSTAQRCSTETRGGCKGPKEGFPGGPVVLAIQGPLVLEDPTRLGATEPMCLN